MKRLAGIVLAGALAACGKAELARGPYEIIQRAPTGEALGKAPDPTTDEWSIARERLVRLRASQPKRPYVERVRLAIGDPRTGKRYEARGAVAINPGRAARMMLVGPGGTTALDVWVTKEHFRFSVPAINLKKRGGSDPADARGLPIGMLRWWFLSPLAGRLLLARSTSAESAWILRDGAATVTLRSNGERFVALRREGDALEGIEWFARGLVPQGGAHGQYLEGRFGLRVDVMVEEVLETEPDPAAFVDPDEPETAL